MESPNIPKESFNQDLCTYLEYHLTKTFAKANDNQMQYLWCDGVSLPSVEAQLTKKSVNDSRRIITNAWIGLDGQTLFEMTIIFGPRSLSKYARGLSLLDCLPSDNTSDWITLDLNARTIELQLI